LGKSGIGKSVLLRHILGIEAPDKGDVLINGINITKLPQKDLYNTKKNMGMLFQSAALFDSMNVEQNTGFYLAQHPDPQTDQFLTKNELKERVKESLSMVNLEGTEEKMPSDLSGGMKKRAGLARLIAYRPKILLYDEPTTGLDPMTAQHINELIIKTQNRLKGTSVIVTHDIHSAIFVGDRIALIEDGVIKHIAEPDAFLKIKDPTIEFLKDILEHHPRARKERLNV
jgi:phospholipid/cholesterol/gamma-HCH transport system ATP-binding protein